jgi:hypothetical protein
MEILYVLFLKLEDMEILSCGGTKGYTICSDLRKELVI